MNPRDPGHADGRSTPCSGWVSAVPGPGGDARLNLLLTYGGWQDDSWADRLPRLLEPMGVRTLRAQSGRQAMAILQTSRVHLAVVDLRLPLEASATRPAEEEGGPRILELLTRLDDPPPTLIVKRGRSARDDARELHAALRAGAFAAIDPPKCFEEVLRALQRMLARHYGNAWPAGESPRTPSPD